MKKRNSTITEIGTTQGKQQHLRFRLIQGEYCTRKLAALPSIRKGEEWEGAGLGCDMFAFPSSGHTPGCRGSIPENSEAGCTTHIYHPISVSLASSTSVHSWKGTTFSYTLFQAEADEATISKEWKNKQAVEKEQQKSHQGKGKYKTSIQTDVQMMYLFIKWEGNGLIKTWTYWFS